MGRTRRKQHLSQPMVPSGKDGPIVTHFYDGFNKNPALEVQVDLDISAELGEGREGGGGAEGDDDYRIAVLVTALFHLSLDIWHLIEPHLFNMAEPDYMKWDVPELGLVELQLRNLSLNYSRVDLVDCESGSNMLRIILTRKRPGGYVGPPLEQPSLDTEID